MLPLLPRIVLLVVSFLYVFTAPEVRAADEAEAPQGVPVKLIIILSLDAQGKPLKFPSHLFFDPSMDETYVLAGGKLNIYGPDFYPVLGLGAGRGADALRGGFIDRDGMLYLCQGAGGGKPARLTIFNAAFFPVREIEFKGFKDAEKFLPERVAVSQDGLIYLVGANTRGAVVLDQQGQFLRWLKPQDRIFAKEAVEEAMQTQADVVGIDGKEGAAEGGGPRAPAPEGLYADIPEELLPKAKEGKEEEEQKGIAPVRLIDLEIDSEGHLYLLSEETSKIYVYSANEEFLFSFGQKGGAFGKMSRPRGLAVDEQKKSVYVVDYMRHTVLMYDLAGKFMHEIGGMGTGPGWFYYPNDVALNKKGELMVADLFNQRVQVMEIQYKARFPMFGTQAKPPAADGGGASPPEKEEPAASEGKALSQGEAAPLAESGGANAPAATRVKPESAAKPAGNVEEPLPREEPLGVEGKVPDSPAPAPAPIKVEPLEVPVGVGR